MVDRVLNTVFGPNREAATDGWTTSYENLQTLFSSANTVSTTNQRETQTGHIEKTR
jgi:hypothetical protein